MSIDGSYVPKRVGYKPGHHDMPTVGSMYLFIQNSMSQTVTEKKDETEK